MHGPKVSSNASDDANDRWGSFKESIGTTPRVIIDPDVYLGYVIPPDPLEGHSQETLDRSIAVAVEIYRDSFRTQFNLAQAPVTVEQYSYVGPFAYGKGGPIGAPSEVVSFIVDQAVWSQLGWAVIVDILAGATWKAGRAFLNFLKDSKYPVSASKLPCHDPYLVQAICEAHARKQYGDLRVGKSSIHSAWPPSADLPYEGNIYTVAVPYRNGSIIYVFRSAVSF